MQFPEAVSTYAGDIDGLIILIAVIVGFWFFLAEGVFFWLLYKYRASANPRAGYYIGKEHEVKKWIHWSHVLVLICDIFIIVGAVRVWYNVKQELPKADRTVRVISQQWSWTFVHPGKDGVLDTADDVTTVDALHIEEGINYHYKLTSLDVVHSFSVPAFRLKQDAIPGRTITGWFKTLNGFDGKHFDIQCAEICGIGHGVMGAKLYVHSKAEHAAWLATNDK